MILKSLILGVVFSLGIFAVKSGIGISYCLAGQQRKREKAGSLLLFSFTYFMVYLLAAFVLQKVDPVRDFPIVQRSMQSGMLIHYIIAALMTGWGLILLKKRETLLTTSRSWGWLLLALPCPVCGTVIILSLAVFMSYFPDNPLRVVLLFYLVFMAITMVTMGLTQMFQARSSLQPDTFLGGAMLLMASYFLLSATIMPQFSDLDKIYRMACYHTDTTCLNGSCVFIVLLLAATAFAAGFGFTSKKSRSIK
jgi:predicted transporter